jgi:hypothetical protein
MLNFKLLNLNTMKKLVINLFLCGIKGFALFSPSPVQTGSSFLLLKKLTICLLFILFATLLKAQKPLPSPYQSWSFINYENHTGVPDSAIYYHDISTLYPADVVINKSTKAYNCHAFAWPNDNSYNIIADGHDSRYYDKVNGYFRAPYIYWGPSGMYMTTTDSLHAEIAVFGTGDVANSGTIVHSAVRITNPNSSNKAISSGDFFNKYSKYAGWYVSKWGEGPLVIHKLRNCPDCGNNVVFFRKTLDPPGANYITYKIDGPNIVCSSGATFTIPSSGVSSVTWTPGPNLTLFSSQGTSCVMKPSGNVGGTSYVQATVYSVYGTSSDTRQVAWVGLPQSITSISTSQYTPGPGTSTNINVPKGSWTHFYCFPFNTGAGDMNDLPLTNAPPDSHGATSYTWTANPSSYTKNPEPNNARTALIAFNQLYYYTLTATASNVCGSVWYPQSIYVTSGYGFSLSPNPASNDVTVTMLKGNNPDAGQTFTGNALPDSTVQTMYLQSASEVQTNVPVTYTVKIVNSFGSLLYSSKKSGDSFTIPVDNIRKGNYLVQISDGKAVSVQTLIISR